MAPELCRVRGDMGDTVSIACREMEGPHSRMLEGWVVSELVHRMRRVHEQVFRDEGGDEAELYFREVNEAEDGCRRRRRDRCPLAMREVSIGRRGGA